MALHIAGQNGPVYIFLITWKVKKQISNMNQQKNGLDPPQQPGTTILTAAF